MKKGTYYKCVRERGKALVSARLWIGHESIDKRVGKTFLLHYSTKKYTEAKVGVIFAFDNLENVLRFAEGFRHTQIWEVKGIESEIKPKITYCNSEFERLVDFWTLSSEDLLVKYGEVEFNVPKGTVGLSRCKLVKRIK